MARKKQMPLIRPSAYPGARLDSTTWRAMFGISTTKMNAVVPHAGSNNKRPAETAPGKARCGPEIVPESNEHHLTFLQNFGLMGASLLLVIATSILWALWLIIQNVTPNAAANYLMNTTAFDSGQFWLVVGPDTQQLILAGCGLGLVQLGYLYALLKMTWWINEDLSDSTTNYVLKEFTLCLTHRDGTRQQHLLAFWNDLTGFHGQRRKFWGSEIVFDAMFGMAFAVLYPLSTTVHGFCNFDLGREHLLLYLEESAGHVSLECQARLMANPSQYSGFLILFDQLRMKAPLNFAITVALNASFCYRLKRVIEARIRGCRKLLHNNQDIFAPRTQPPTRWSVPKYMILPFLTLTVFTISYAYRYVDSSASSCALYPECVVFAHRMDNDDLCPCLVLVGVDYAPATYEEWINPVNVTSRVQALAASGNLRVLQLINHRLREWPDELEWRINIQHMHQDASNMVHKLHEPALALTFLHMESLPLLTALPSLDGLANLQSLSLVELPSIQALLSFQSLKRLDRLELVALPQIDEIPDLALLSSQLPYLVLQDMQACCNGNIGACDPTQPLCSSGVSCATNTTTIVAKQRLTELLQRSSWTNYASLANKDSTTRAAIDVCGGVLYRKCTGDGEYSINDSVTADQTSMCYNQCMHVIACRPAEMVDINIRELEIQKGLGAACDPIEEAWLGCASGWRLRRALPLRQ